MVANAGRFTKSVDFVSRVAHCLRANAGTPSRFDPPAVSLAQSVCCRISAGRQPVGVSFPEKASQLRRLGQVRMTSSRIAFCRATVAPSSFALLQLTWNWTKDAVSSLKRLPFTPLSLLNPLIYCHHHLNPIAIVTPMKVLIEGQSTAAGYRCRSFQASPQAKLRCDDSAARSRRPSFFAFLVRESAGHSAPNASEKPFQYQLPGSSTISAASCTSFAVIRWLTRRKEKLTSVGRAGFASERYGTTVEDDFESSLASCGLGC